jgi:hypothetical protein
MALSTYAEVARDIFVEVASQGKFTEPQLKTLAEYSFKASKVFIEVAREIRNKDE